MHWQRRVGILLIFSCMPAMAPLWAMLGDNLGLWPWTISAMIRVLTPFFVLGLILTLAGGSNSTSDYEEE
ncbi:MAG: hypothetical protein QF440_01370 [Candidatus Thalassarchaeaceae archaeon]|nr:hypothetical protein [Candidatus Thalassarchaeaceae archaeon]